jgi:3-oxoacyl-[acyl-carrier protein] reductase
LKKVFITGASRGIGREVAKIFKENKWYVTGTATSVNSTTSCEYVDEWLFTNFSVEDDVTKFYENLKKIDHINTCINNVGINLIKEQNNVSFSDYKKLQKVDLECPYFISSIASQKMIQNGGGKIINIASVWSIVSKEHRTLYSTFKTGLVGLTRAMSVEWASKNILVNAVSPGFVNTDLTKCSLDSQQQISMAKLVPLKRFAEPEEIAKLVYFLGSDRNTYITGQNIIIDGGFTIV